MLDDAMPIEAGERAMIVAEAVTVAEALKGGRM